MQGLRKELWFIAVLTAGLAVAQIVALMWREVSHRTAGIFPMSGFGPVNSTRHCRPSKTLPVTRRPAAYVAARR